MSSHQQPQQSKTERFMRGAGTVQDPDNQLWWPAKQVVAMIQYLIAAMIVTIGEALKSIVTGEKPGKHSHDKRRIE